MLINKFFPLSVLFMFKNAMTRDGDSSRTVVTTITTNPRDYFRLYVLRDGEHTRITDSITGSDTQTGLDPIYFVDVPKNFASINLKRIFMGMRIGYAINSLDLVHIDEDRSYGAYILEKYPLTGYLKHPIHKFLLDFHIGMICGLLMSLPENDDE